MIEKLKEESNDTADIVDHISQALLSIPLFKNLLLPVYKTFILPGLLTKDRRFAIQVIESTNSLIDTVEDLQEKMLEIYPKMQQLAMLETNKNRVERYARIVRNYIVSDAPELEKSEFVRLIEDLSEYQIMMLVKIKDNSLKELDEMIHYEHMEVEIDRIAGIDKQEYTSNLRKKLEEMGFIKLENKTKIVKGRMAPFKLMVLNDFAKKFLEFISE